MAYLLTQKNRLPFCPTQIESRCSGMAKCDLCMVSWHTSLCGHQLLATSCHYAFRSPTSRYLASRKLAFDYSTLKSFVSSRRHESEYPHRNQELFRCTTLHHCSVFLLWHESGVDQPRPFVNCPSQGPPAAPLTGSGKRIHTGLTGTSACSLGGPSASSARIAQYANQRSRP